MYLIFVTFLLSTALVYGYCHWAARRGLLDKPNERSSHARATPRGGGIVVAVLWLVGTAGLAAMGALAWGEFFALVPGALLTAAVGYIDDIKQLSAKTRAAVHVLAGITTVAALGGFPAANLGPVTIDLGVLGMPFGVLIVAWSINLFNFMDGLDGLAGTEGVFVFGVGGYFLHRAGGTELAMVAWLLAAALAGFLVWNRPPAKLFMGDVGSGFLGFLVGAFAIVGEVKYRVPALLWFILYGFFWFDASVTLLRRMIGGEAWYSAHRSHAYQRLHHGSRWSHAQVLRGAVGVNMALAALAIVADMHREALPYYALGSVVLLVILYGLTERAAPMVTSARS